MKNWLLRLMGSGKDRGGGFHARCGNTRGIDGERTIHGSSSLSLSSWFVFVESGSVFQERDRPGLVSFLMS